MKASDAESWDTNRTGAAAADASEGLDNVDDADRPDDQTDPAAPTNRPRGRVGIHLGVGRRRRRGTAAMPLVKPLTPPPAANMNSGGGLALAEAVTYLADLARSVAADRGHVCIVEFAGSSESTYVHVRRPSVETTFETPPRPRHETWFGIRISAHPAKYACSGDYEQVLLSRSPGVDEVHRAAGVLIEAMRHGGRPVAEPHRVRGELWAAQVAAAIGQMATMIRGEREIVWTWQGIDRRWQTEADDPGPPPTTIPRVQLDTATTAAIRHRVNRREAWAATERRCDG